MQNLFEAAEIITSNLLYRQIIHNFDNMFHPQDALLLVPVTNCSSDLEVVEVIGALPTSLSYTDGAALFAELPALARDIACLLYTSKKMSSSAVERIYIRFRSKIFFAGIMRSRMWRLLACRISAWAR